jgi:hypothetical protein
VQFGVADFENWMSKLACKKSPEAFCTADCVLDAQKKSGAQKAVQLRLLRFIDYSISECLAEVSSALKIHEEGARRIFQQSPRRKAEQ